MEVNKLVTLAENQYLQTARLLLSPLTLNHLLDYHEYISDDQNLTYEFFPTKSLEESKESLVVWNIAQPLGRYGIILKETHKLIGHITLRLSADTLSAEVGYTLNKQFWTHGYATEALAKIIELAFTDLQLEKLIATYVIENTASSRVLEKKGFIEIKQEERLSLRGELLPHGTAILTNDHNE